MIPLLYFLFSASPQTVAMCHLHYKLSENKITGITTPPTKESVVKTLRAGDLDESGHLSQEEFVLFAQEWFKDRGNLFFLRLVLTSIISMVVLPGSANALQKSIPGAHRVPSMLFKVGFGIGMFLFSTPLPQRP